MKAFDLQREVGLDIFSDGEYRRSNWAGDFISSVDGYLRAEVPIRFEWRLPDQMGGKVEGQVREVIEAMPQQSGMVVGSKLRQKQRLTEHELTFLKDKAPGPFKVTLPAASYIVGRGWKPGVTDKIYSSRWELAEDVSRILKDEVESLQAEGVPYIQIDNPHWPDYIPEDRRQAWRSIGVDPDAAMDEDIRMDNAVTQGLDRSKVTLAPWPKLVTSRAKTCGGSSPVLASMRRGCGLLVRARTTNSRPCWGRILKFFLSEISKAEVFAV